MTGRLRERAVVLAAGSCVLMIATGLSSLPIAVATGTAGRVALTGDEVRASQDGQIVAVAGSSRFLGYVKYDTGQSSTARLFERTANGTVRKLGTVDPASSQFSLAGRTLNASPLDGGTVQVWNLNTGKEHDRTLPLMTAWIGAAPNGYLLVTSKAGKTGYQDLETVSTSGTITSLGNPFPAGRSYRVTVNAHRYVAFSIGGSKPRGVRTATFDDPGQVTTVMRSTGRASAAITYCGVPTAHFVACDTDSNRYALQIRNLDGKLVAHSSNFDAPFLPAPAMLNGTAFWLTHNPHGQLRQMSKSGAVTHSTRNFATNGPIRAFNRIVVDSPRRTTLLETKSASSKPTVLAHG